MTTRTIALQVGEPAPWFRGRTSSNNRFAFHTAAGRYVVLSLFGSAADPRAAEVLARLYQVADRFDDKHLAFFGVSTDPVDESKRRVVDRRPGVRFFWDFDRSISALYGAVAADSSYSAHTYE